MKAVGVVVEYNPFHNGHLFHLQKARQLADADVVVAVMSGFFLQRGEPALTDKWTRAQMALANGADVVIELPYLHAVQRADRFASGAIRLLAEIGCTFFCFGSEKGRIEPFLETDSMISRHDALIQSAMKPFLEAGIRYPAAVEKARAAVFPNGLPVDLTKPNNILGFHYVQANRQLGAPMQPLTIERTGAGFHDQTAAGTIASATAIRTRLADGEDVAPFLPQTVSALLHGRFLHTWEPYWPLLRYRLLTGSGLEHICEAEEGIERRMQKAAFHAESFASFLHTVQTKRYTQTRLQRLAVHLLTGTTKEDTASASVDYIRLLGMTETGQRFLKTAKKKTGMPIISRTAAAQSMLTHDLQACFAYASVTGAPDGYSSQLLKREFGPPIRMPNSLR